MSGSLEIPLSHTDDPQQGEPIEEHTKIVNRLLDRKNIFTKKGTYYTIGTAEEEKAFDERFSSLPKEKQGAYLRNLELLQTEYQAKTAQEGIDTEVLISNMHSELLHTRFADVQNELYGIESAIEIIDLNLASPDYSTEGKLRLTKIRAVLQKKHETYQSSYNNLQAWIRNPQVNQYFTLSELPEAIIAEKSQRQLFYVDDSMPTRVGEIINKQPTQDGRYDITVLFNKLGTPETFHDVYDFYILKLSEGGYFEGMTEQNEYGTPSDIRSKEPLQTEQLYATLQDRKLSRHDYLDKFDLSKEKIDQGPIGDCYLISALNFVGSHICREPLISRSVTIDNNQQTITFNMPLGSPSPTKTYTFTREDIQSQKGLTGPLGFKALEYLYAQLRIQQGHTGSYEKILEGGDGGRALKDLFGDLVSLETHSFNVLEKLQADGNDPSIFLTIDSKPDNYVSFYTIDNITDPVVTDIAGNQIQLYNHHEYLFESARVGGTRLIDPNHPERPFTIPYNTIIHYFSHYTVGTLDLSKAL